MIKHILLIFVNSIYLLAAIYFLHSQINIYSLKIPYALVFKKLVWNFYKQIEIYEERDSRVKYYLTHYNDKYGKEKNCYSKNNKEKIPDDELFNNCCCNFRQKEEVPIDSKFI